jgi:hypothetical protein
MNYNSFGYHSISKKVHKTQKPDPITPIYVGSSESGF